jgi:hypothetical protein
LARDALAKYINAIGQRIDCDDAVLLCCEDVVQSSDGSLL